MTESVKMLLFFVGAFAACFAMIFFAGWFIRGEQYIAGSIFLFLGVTWTMFVGLGAVIVYD